LQVGTEYMYSTQKPATSPLFTYLSQSKSPMAVPSGITSVLGHPAIWRFGDMPSSARGVLCTGFDSLDSTLPARGWERGALTEILLNEQGVGELTLLLPALGAAAAEGGIVLAAPPYVPFPHSWEARGISLKQLIVVRAQSRELLWTLEQAARSGTCAMVVGWTSSCSKELDYRALRRLHMAADAGGTALILFRPMVSAREASPAPTRLTLRATDGELEIHVFKRRASFAGAPVRVPVFPVHWNRKASPGFVRRTAIGNPADRRPALARVPTAVPFERASLPR
jgi:hypothetical protein